MKILIKRRIYNPSFTQGELYIDDKYICDTIEDTERVLPSTCPNTSKSINCACKEKVYSETAIPKDIYKCSFTYSNTFGRKLLAINNVPHFLGIRIHRGNTAKDSSGCIIVGEKSITNGTVINSTQCESKLNALFAADDDIILEII